MKTKQQHNNTKNHKIWKKKYKSELMLHPPTHLWVFLGFSDFLTWQNPNNCWPAIKALKYLSTKHGDRKVIFNLN